MIIGSLFLPSPVQTLTEIKQLLADRGLAPRHALGQNFLTDHNLIRKLVDAAAVTPNELVLEVGPGTGTLTEELLDRGCRVVAAELDRGLAQLNRDRLGARPAFTLVEGDCLHAGALHPALASALGTDPFVLVANLPYGAATPLMLDLLTRHPRCRGMFVTIQREVADRLAAGPESGKAYGAVSVAARCLADIERVGTLPPECFWPRPDVTSAMLALRRRPEPLVGDLDRWPAIARRVAELFQSRRKQLGGTIRRLGASPDAVLAEPLAGISARPEQRPEELPPPALAALADRLDRALTA